MNKDKHKKLGPLFERRDLSAKIGNHYITIVEIVGLRGTLKGRVDVGNVIVDGQNYEPRYEISDCWGEDK